ncbi:hypothetical protein B0T16DRAFT_453476 [Cercophora newfieldiana]|uniref:2'-phosphotransferase n=1 Tax=Cercophora newfieldiana TaxID=92897 RepID=A0AA40D2E9_9PEZI|nr:hypothetical protein B0T16DRAFT_453476 [Cercophora newfieldiana]
MAAAVAVPLSAINNELGGVLPPSALVQHSPRHGRSRGMSFKAKNGNRGRGYSVHEDRDVSIAKALMFVLKRTIKEDEVDEEDEEDHRLVADAEGWVGLDDVLEHEKLKSLEADLEDIQRVIANASKPRFHLRQTSKDKAEEPSSYTIRRIPTNRESIAAPIPIGDKLTLSTPDLPEFLVYETSYQRYPLILTTGTIARAPGGTAYLSFTPVTVSEDGAESRAPSQGEAAEVSIWIHLRSALEASPDLLFQRTEGGAIITSDEIPKGLWKKAVARRPDIGLLFEDGEVKKELPAGLRGKGKGKARKGKDGRGQGLKREGSEEESASGSAGEDEE